MRWFKKPFLTERDLRSEANQQPGAECVTIRGAERSDREAVIRYWGALMQQHRELDARFELATDAAGEYGARFLQSVRSSQACVLVAVMADSVVGYIYAEMQPRPHYFPHEKYGFIAELYVDPACRLHGVGGRLVQTTLEWFSRRDVHAVHLLAATVNRESRAFWEAQGFSDFLTFMHIPLRSL